MRDMGRNPGPVADHKLRGQGTPGAKLVRIGKAVAQIIRVAVGAAIGKVSLTDLRPLAGFAKRLATSNLGKKGDIWPRFSFEAGVDIGKAVGDVAELRPFRS